MLAALHMSPTLETAGVTRVVVTYRSIDDEGPYTLTATYPLAALLTAHRDGTEVPEELTTYQLTRG